MREETTPVEAPALVEQAAPARTPDNTPLPGGGSWKWDTQAQAWVPNETDGGPAADNLE